MLVNTSPGLVGRIGHIRGKPVTNTTRQALEWTPQGKRRVDWPKMTWKHWRCGKGSWLVKDPTNEDGPKPSALSFWRSAIVALCSQGSEDLVRKHNIHSLLLFLILIVYLFETFPKKNIFLLVRQPTILSWSIKFV